MTTIQHTMAPEMALVGPVGLSPNDENRSSCMFEPTGSVSAPLTIAKVHDGGRELSQTVLYIGQIHGGVPEASLAELVALRCATPAVSVKLLHDKNRPGFNYGFVEFSASSEASDALERLNGAVLGGLPLKVTWAYQTQQSQSENMSTFNLFIGDLSLEINDESLKHFFAKYPSLHQANVMWDMKTGRSRGYGFVNFKEKQDAEDALTTLNGALLGDRPIRLNWASHRPQQHNNHQPNQNRMISAASFVYQPYAQAPASTGGILAPVMLDTPNIQNYEQVLGQTPDWMTVVYLGNLSHATTQNDLIPLLQNFGYIVNFKLLAEKGCAFVTYDTHERAAMAIVQLLGFTINGRPLKCGWGKQLK